MTELYKKYRPKTFSEVIGQREALKSLVGMVKQKRVPHTILLSGPSGVGKTTIARIVARKLRTSDRDLQEINAADFRGIDTVREIRDRMSLAPIGGRCRVWIIDECHQLSSQAQNAFLKLLEDTPAHVYFMLATTHPQKLLQTIRTRCYEVKLSALSQRDLEKLVNKVASDEGFELEKDVASAIVEQADGSARKALVLLEQVSQLTSEEERLTLLRSTGTQAKAIELARALIDPRAKWTRVKAILKDMDEDPESVRWLVLSYCQSVLIGGGKMANRAYRVIDAFRDNFYDCKKAGLVAACYEIVVIED